MSERLAQARAEAERRYVVSVESEGVLIDTNQVEAFADGVEWADASPQPRTITRAEFREALEEHVGVGASGEWVTVEDMLTAALASLGIGVSDE